MQYVYIDKQAMHTMIQFLPGCSREGLTEDGVTVSPDQDSYPNGVEVTHGCKRALDLSGPKRRTCHAGVWDPPLCTCTKVTCKGNDFLSHKGN